MKLRGAGPGQNPGESWAQPCPCVGTAPGLPGLLPTEHLALEARDELPKVSQWCGKVGSHSLGVTQSLIYAFSRACIVFTTANSSAMLSYLRGRKLQVRLPRQETEGPSTSASPASVPLRQNSWSGHLLTRP